jgi:putative permease
LWGVFFAIPLATLIKAIINAWPTQMIVAEKLAQKSIEVQSSI